MTPQVFTENNPDRLHGITFYRNDYYCSISNTWNTKPNGQGVTYKNCEEILVSSDMVLYAQWRPLKGVLNGHEYVDLDLPSGTLWAICNIGADAPEEYGYYFAWGETEPKEIYNWETYKYCNGGSTQLTKYCDSSNYGFNGFVDNLYNLLPDDDAATTNWGIGFYTPTFWQWSELVENTTRKWVIQNGVNGALFTGSNGQTLFLPAAGDRWEEDLFIEGSVCRFWTKDRYMDPSCAWDSYIDEVGGSNSGLYRSCGLTIRAVCFSE